MSTFPWDNFSDQGNFAGALLDLLPDDNSLAGPTVSFDNVTAKDPHGIFRLKLGSYSPITSGDCYVNIFGSKSLDAESSYEDVPLGGGADSNILIAQIPILPGTNPKHVTSGLIFLLPYHYKFYIQNSTNASFAGTGNSLNLYTGKLANI